MKTFSALTCSIGITVLLGTVVPLYAIAESAPVYDVDQMPPSFGGEVDQQEAPPPPPQIDNQTGAFVPSQESIYGEAPSAPAPRGTLDQRVRRVEAQVNNMQGAENAAKVDSLQDQVQSLRGQVEQLTHELQKLQSQQKTMYSDLDKRVTADNKPTPPPAIPAPGSKKDANVASAETTSTASEASSAANTSTNSDEPGLTPTGKSVKKPKASASMVADAGKPDAAAQQKQAKSDDQPNVAEEQQIYQTAYNFIKAKQYNDAVKALQSMLKKYPSGQFAANAHYWLGELYGLMDKQDQALREFSTVVNNFPNSPRVSDAQLKLGLIFAAQSQWPDAKKAFKAVINHYPGTASARLASEQIKQLKQAGH